MAFRPGDGDTVQSHSPGEHGRGAAREAPGVHAAGALREPLPHQRLRAGAGLVPRELH